MKEIEQTLRERVGLEVASVGSSLIQRSVRLRMKCHGIERTEDYTALMLSSWTEWSELMESVLVTETWFFRDTEPFSALVRQVLEKWLPANPSGRVRLLSLACSSGEEPYSMAMALLDAGLSSERLEIDAVDISARALTRARKGIYGKNSFRGRNLRFRNKYFQSTAEGFVLSPLLIKAVRFYQGNVLAEDFQLPNSTYDFIFFRNLLIYFDRPTQEKALARIDKLLVPGGLLFIGAAEQPLVFECGFVSAHLPMAFACRKGKASADQSGLALRGEERLLPRPCAVVPRVKDQLPSDSEGTAPACSLAEPRAADLTTAQRLADAGRLDEAASLCEAHLRNTEPSAQAYYLLGLIRDATGDPAAPDYYRKALYLDPNHYDSLLQLALWSQKNGETGLARRFKNRAQRVKTKT